MCQRQNHLPVISSHRRLEPGLDVGPGSLVLVFLLDPAQAGVAIVVSDPLEQVEGEGADLLQGVDGDLVLETSFSPGFGQVVVDFASADQHL